jgi:hypothetical protein
MAAQRDPKDLLDSISFQALECLNEHPAHPASNVLKQGYREDDGLFLESDTDEQLLIKIRFQQLCKLQVRGGEPLARPWRAAAARDRLYRCTARFHASAGGSLRRRCPPAQGIAIKGPAEEGPKVIKLYVNKPHLGFSDVDSVPPAQEFTLGEGDLSGKQLALKLVKFTAVDDLVGGAAQCCVGPCGPCGALLPGVAVASTLPQSWIALLAVAALAGAAVQRSSHRSLGTAGCCLAPTTGLHPAACHAAAPPPAHHLPPAALLRRRPSLWRATRASATPPRSSRSWCMVRQARSST